MIGWALVGWGLAVNLLAFAAFGLDKRRAQQQAWRLSEAYLLLLAAMGGWIGAKAGQRWFRHKTRKQPFGSALNATIVVPVVAALVLFTPLVPYIAKSMGTSVSGPGALPDRPFPRRFGPGS